MERRREMDLFKKYRGIICQTVSDLFGTDAPIDNIVVEQPKNKTLSHLSTNAAMVLNKQLGKAPRAIAEEITARLGQHPDVTEVEIAGPGFINFNISLQEYHELICQINQLGNAYGKSDLGAGKKVNLEFVSVNPTGPMHIGHSRAAIVGDALAAILKHCGYDVTREYYINDAGGQIDVLANSTYARYLQALGEEAEIPEDGYPGEYLVPVGEALKERYGNKLQAMSLDERNEIIKPFAVEMMMTLIRADLAKLGVYFDSFVSEKQVLHDGGKLKEAVEFMQSKGLLYRGVLEPPKGMKPDDWEPREQLLFKATDFGDDVDRPLQKSNGDYTYFAADIAYHEYKLGRGFNDMVLLLGADHGGYVKRLQAVVKALSDGKANIDIMLNQLVNLLKDGQPYKMSKRRGNFITVGDMLEEVNKDILRFIMLTRRVDTVMDIDFTKAKEHNKDNPVFYVQYAHTRACSVLRNVGKLGIEPAQATGELSSITDPNDIQLLLLLASFPKIVESAAKFHEPHRLTFYLYDLATEFHGLWAKGNENEELRFVLEGQSELTKARGALVLAVATTLKAGLDLLGVTPLEEM
jgi:arginyl-tRNA synthetase